MACPEFSQLKVVPGSAEAVRTVGAPSHRVMASLSTVKLGAGKAPTVTVWDCGHPLTSASTRYSPTVASSEGELRPAQLTLSPGAEATMVPVSPGQSA